MSTAVLSKAIGLFAVTNIDDLILLAVLFGRSALGPSRKRAIIAGQYLGFFGIIGVASAGARGARLLPHAAIRYLGLLPLTVGLHGGWRWWHDRRSAVRPDGLPELTAAAPAPTILLVAASTFAAGGDNLSVYVPAFTGVRMSTWLTYVGTFLVLVAAWCAASLYIASRPLMTRAMSRFGGPFLPLIFIAIGVALLTT